MEANTTYILHIPESDNNLLRSLAKKFGWKATKQKPQRITHLDKAIKSAHEDELFETNDIDVLMKNLTE